MTEPKNPRRSIARSDDSGFFRGLTDQFKLVLRLMGDKRVPFYLKALPLGTLVYFVVPDLAIGPIDDAVIVGLGTYIFIEMCPPNVVEEHRARLRGESMAATDSDVVDADFKQE
ncbi:MAG: hypothetical protein EPO32_02050 [Anaerolineae bacterium]|nr:MAG: hypothetical protein EPO32_02050 [Anaerolineae bacterium]